MMEYALRETLCAWQMPLHCKFHCETTWQIGDVSAIALQNLARNCGRTVLERVLSDCSALQVSCAQLGSCAEALGTRISLHHLR